MRILVVEDDPILAEALVECLRAEAYAVDHATTGSEAAELVDLNPYDLVVLDWSIPPPSGIELLRGWRGQGLMLPVLMLTGHTGLDERIGGLDSGADDYLTKPFLFGELLARIRSLLRRRLQPHQPVLAAGDLEMDRDARAVLVAGRPVDLRPKEFAILEYLLSHVDRVVPRTELVEHVWDPSFEAFSNVVNVTVHRLRSKLDGGEPRTLLLTVKGVGWVLKSRRE